MKKLFVNKLLVTSLSLLFACTVAAKNTIPETTHDGLVRVKSNDLALVYKNPKAQILPYTSVKLLDCGVAFKKRWEKEHKSGPSRLSTNDMNRIKERLSAQFREVFEAELKNAGYKIVDHEGDDVLILRPAIVNLDVTAPESMRTGGMNKTYASSAGSMTLFMELYDGPTNDIIARVYDAKADRDDGFVKWQNRSTNAYEAKKIIKAWVNVLITHLDKVKETKS